MHEVSGRVRITADGLDSQPVRLAVHVEKTMRLPVSGANGLDGNCGTAIFCRRSGPRDTEFGTCGRIHMGRSLSAMICASFVALAVTDGCADSSLRHEAEDSLKSLSQDYRRYSLPMPSGDAQ